MTERTRAPGFYMLYAVLLLALVSGLILGAETRVYAALGLALCISLFVGVLYRPTRWVACAVTALVSLAAMAFSYWAKGMH